MMSMKKRIKLIEDVVIEMNFLTNLEKTYVIEKLNTLDKGNFLHGMGRLVRLRHRDVIEILLEKGILEDVYVLRCPSCGECDMTEMLSVVNKDMFCEILMKDGGYTQEDVYFLVEYYHGECWVCGVDVGIGEIDLDYSGFVEYLRLAI